MKRIFSAALLAFLICSCFSGICLATSNSMPTLDSFESRLKVAFLLTSSGHWFNSTAVSSFIDDTDTVVSIELDDTITLYAILSDGSDTISQIQLVYQANGDIMQATSLLYAIAEVAWATKGINEIDETGDFLNKLDFFDNCDNIGFFNTMESNDIKYCFCVSEGPKIQFIAMDAIV